MILNSKEPLFIPGPGGRLEAILSFPKDGRAIKGAVVVCHPHPLKEGTMHNKVVHYLAKTFNDSDYAALRFNYRGVGLSEGEYGHAVGETDDALSAVHWLQSELGETPLWLAGFSFGGYVALRSATQRPICGLITVAPAVNLLDFQSLALPGCPWLMIHGSADEVVPFADAKNWHDSLANKPQFVIIEESGHFFHGRLNELRDIVKDFITDHEGCE